MTTAMLCLSVGLLLWPRAGSLRRARLAAVRGARPVPGAPTVRALPAPVLAGAAAGLTGALVGTLLVGALAACCAVLAARVRVQSRHDRQEDDRLLALAETVGAFAGDICLVVV